MLDSPVEIQRIFFVNDKPYTLCIVKHKFEQERFQVPTIVSGDDALMLIER